MYVRTSVRMLVMYATCIRLCVSLSVCACEYVCLCMYRFDFQFRELGCLPSDVNERHSAAMSGGGRAEDKKGGDGGEHREEVSVLRDWVRRLS